MHSFQETSTEPRVTQRVPQRVQVLADLDRSNFQVRILTTSLLIVCAVAMLCVTLRVLRRRSFLFHVEAENATVAARKSRRNEARYTLSTRVAQIQSGLRRNKIVRK